MSRITSFHHAANDNKTIKRALKRAKHPKTKNVKGLEFDVWKQGRRLVLSHDEPSATAAESVRATSLFKKVRQVQQTTKGPVPLIAELKKGITKDDVHQLVRLIKLFKLEGQTRITSFYPGKLNFVRSAREKYHVPNIKIGLNLVGAKLPASVKELKGQLGRIALLRNTLALVKKLNYLGSQTIDSVHFPMKDILRNQEYVDLLNKERESKHLPPLQVIPYTSNETSLQRQNILRNANKKRIALEGLIV